MWCSPAVVTSMPWWRQSKVLVCSLFLIQVIVAPKVYYMLASMLSVLQPSRDMSASTNSTQSTAAQSRSELEFNSHTLLISILSHAFCFELEGEERDQTHHKKKKID